MLLLSRHAGESIYIGDAIKITVIQHKRGYLQLGITAPPEILILREELVGTPDHSGHVSLEKTRMLDENEL
jgi:carbon storage regulator